MKLRTIIFICAIWLAFGHHNVQCQEEKISEPGKQSNANGQLPETTPIESVHQSDGKQAHSENAGSEKQETGNKPNELRDWLTFAVNLLLFILVGIQARISHKQLSAMDGQITVMQNTLDNTRNAFAVSERAYVGIKQLSFLGGLTAYKAQTLSFRFINGGKTPAWNFIAVARLILDEPNKTIDQIGKEFPIEWENCPAIGAFIAAGAEKTVIITAGEIEIYLDTLDAIHNKKLKVFVVGEARYKDFQGKEQRLTFSTVYDPIHQNFEEVSDWHNDPI